MGSIDHWFPGKPAARRSRRKILDATRTRTRPGVGTYRFIASEEALCRPRRNEGRICRDLWPRVDMESLVFGGVASVSRTPDRPGNGRWSIRED